ncbi:MAG: hypothetical protein K6L60_02035 [Oceanobacter sp.]
MAKYVIYENSFGYNDECFYVSGSFIDSVFDDKDEAEAACRKLELKHQKYFVSEHLRDQKSIFEYGWDEEFQKKINDFTNEKVGKPLLVSEEDEPDDRVFTSLNDDDLLSLADLLENKGYQLVEYDDVVSFFALKFIDTEMFLVEIDEECYLVHSESKDALIDSLSEFLTWNDDIVDLFKSQTRSELGELAESPSLLEKLLKSEGFNINMIPKKGIDLEGKTGQFCLSVNELLKKPILEVVSLSLDEVRELEKEIRDNPQRFY